MFFTAAGLLCLVSLPAQAHTAIWSKAAYGQDASRDNGQLLPTIPQSLLKFDDWWFHGSINYPPPEGEFDDIPSGGTFHGTVTCMLGGNNASVSACAPGDDSGATNHWGESDDNSGSLHTFDKPGTPLDQIRDVRGCGLSIAYESDAHKIKPEDFVVISVNHSCPWVQDTEFQIPPNLPACPPGGCHCMWGWIHSQNAGRSNEMYTRVSRCNVSGQLGNEALPKPLVARKCPVDKNNCTKTAKQMHYFAQAEGNNNFQDMRDPPFYNADYGFEDGAQMNLFDTDDGSLWNDNYCDWAPPPVQYTGDWKAWPRLTWNDDPKPIDLDPEAETNPLRPGCASPYEPGLPFDPDTSKYTVTGNPKPEDIEGTSVTAQWFLKYVNDFRAQFDAPALKWNATMAEEMDREMQGCNYGMTHLSNAVWSGFGDDQNATLLGAMDGWAKGWKDYMPEHKLNAFTRMVWKSSTDLACLWQSRCPAGNGDWANGIIVHCQIGPESNIEEEINTNVGEFTQPMANWTASVTSA